MLLTLLVYSYCTGIFSSRQIELSTHTNVAARLVCANTHPDHEHSGETTAPFSNEPLPRFWKWPRSAAS